MFHKYSFDGPAVTSLRRRVWTKPNTVPCAAYRAHQTCAMSSAAPKALFTTRRDPVRCFRQHASTPGLSALSTVASNASRPPTRRSNAIIFRGLPPDVDKEEVAGFFSQFGEVKFARVKSVVFRTTVAGGYVRFTSQESVTRALAINGKEVLGRPMSVHALFELVDTVNVGCLPLGIEDDRVTEFFSSCGEVVDVKVHTSLAGGKMGLCYGFVRFASPASATKALKLNRMHFAGHRLNVSRAVQRAEDVTIWDNYAETDEWATRSININNIPPQINDLQLGREFEHCGEINTARVWRELSTGSSLGFGFVHFASPASVPKALAETKEIAGHVLQITRVPPVRPSVLQYTAPPMDHPPTESIFIGRLTYDVDSTQLRREFERFGRVTKAVVLTVPGSGQSRGCGYVYFDSPDAVERAVQHHLSLSISGNLVRIMRNYSQPKSKRDVADSLDIEPRKLYNAHHNRGSWEQDY